MKINQIAIAAAFFVTLAATAQKDQLKTLKKIYDKETPTAKDLGEYRAALVTAEPLIGAASESDRVYFNFYKASTPILEMSMPENQSNAMAQARLFSIANIKNFASAAEAVKQFEKTGKKIYTNDIVETVGWLKPALQNYAVLLGNQGKHKEASDVLFAIYNLDNADADFLYYAANYAITAQDYDAALNYYTKLKDINYSGERTVYYATSVLTDKEDSFNTKDEMTKAISFKTHVKPREEKELSKRGEIYKNIALILVSQDKDAEAKAAIAQARAANPDDTSLMLTEADMYLKLKDTESYKKLVGQILAKNPNDAVLTYNLGVLAMNGNQDAEAETYFKRTIEIDPKNVNAYLNLAAIKLKADTKFVDDMNKLGTSTADNKKYEQLKASRNQLFLSVLPSLEKAYELDPTNGPVIDNLMSVYNYLEMTDKYKALKAKKQ